jgi:nitrogen-specific signal transduction histidine kinase/CheY-like chemotaxis protein
VHRDIRDFKQLEEQLRHSQRLETAGLLASGISHDFNNILTVIQGSCNFITQDLSDESNITKHISLIERSADRAGKLTRQLLAFSRKQRTMPEILSPNELITDITSMLTQTLGDDISFSTTLDSNNFINADPTQIEQIILNLSVNARHAMPNGGDIVLETLDITIPEDHFFRFSPDPLTNGEYVLLKFRDTGSGMDDKTLQHIFEPFYTTKEEGQGTGLGLSVVYGLVAQTGGHIVVFSKTGKGTEFHIYLPKAHGTPKTSTTKKSAKAYKGKGSILIIEDNHDVRSLAVAILESAGYTVSEAVNPSLVLNGEINGVVDLILSDINMPEMSGPEFFEIWLKKHPEANVLFMSGFFDENSYTEILSAKNLILKPFKPSDLLERVASMLKQ